MSSLSQQEYPQTQRKLLNDLADYHADGHISDLALDIQQRGIKAENERLRSEVVSLTRQLHDANNDLLWRDTLAARHAEAYAVAEAAKLNE